MGVHHRLKKQHSSAPSLFNGGSGSGSGSFSSSSSSSSSSMPPKGCMAVRVVGPAAGGGRKEEEKEQPEEEERFVVPVGYLKHPLFVALLKAAEDEYGFEQKGAITIPCGVDHFRRVQGIIHHQRHRHGGAGGGGGGGGHHHGHGHHHGSSSNHFHIAGCFRA